MKWLIRIVCLILCAIPSLAMEFWVAPPPLGSNGNSGFTTNVPMTIATALSNVAEGNIITMMDGTYTGGITVSKSNIMLRAHHKWLAIITNAAAIGVNITGYGVIVDGLRVANSGNNGIKQDASGTTVRNCWIHDSVTSGLLMTGYRNCIAEYNLVENNGTDTTQDHGMYIQFTNQIVRGNVVRGSSSHGIQISTYYLGKASHNVHAYNNLVYDNGRCMTVWTTIEDNIIPTTNWVFGNILIQGTNNGVSPLVANQGFLGCTNNIIIGRGARNISADNGSVVWADYNLVTNTLSASVVDGGHNVVTNTAGFVNEADGLFWLLSSSPARDNALSTACGPVSFFNQSQTLVTDIGAFQFNPLLASDTRVLDPSPSNPDYWDPNIVGNHYIVAGGTGDGGGSTWDNALDDLPATLVRGDTYWVAGGSYGSHTISTPDSGTARITIRKAVGTNHGTDMGWNLSYTNGQAVFSDTIKVHNVGYVTLDGQEEYGIKIDHPDDDDGRAFEISGFDAVNRTGIQLKYVELAGPREDNPTNQYPFAHYTTGVRGEFDNGRIVDFLVSHCNIHGFAELIRPCHTTRLIVEYTKLHDCVSDWDTPYQIHSNLSYFLDTVDFTFRYNEIYNWSQQCLYIMYHSGGTLNIYGNYWHDLIFDDGQDYPINFFFGGIYDGTYGVVRIVNNTFVDCGVKPAIYLMGCSFLDGSYTYNNLIYNCGLPNYAGMATHDYNWYTGGSAMSEASGIAGGAANPFDVAPYISSTVSATMPRNKGLSVATTFDTDADGNARGENDGLWDIGAYEYSELNANPPVITSGDASGAEGAEFSYTILASGSPTNYGAVGLQAGLVCTNSNGRIGGVPAAGTNTVTIWAQNAYGYGSNDVTFSITEAGGILSASPNPLNFGYSVTNIVTSLPLTVSNAGGATLTGNATNPTAGFSLIGDVGFSLEPTETKAITIGFTPTAVGLTSGTVSWTDGTTNSLSGYGFPISPTTNWNMVDALVISQFETNENNYVSQSVETLSANGGVALFGWMAPAHGTIKLFGGVIGTNGSNNSFYVNVNGPVYEATNVWDLIALPDNFTPVYVSQRGKGTFDSPQYPTNSFPVTNGLAVILVGGREAETKIRDLHIEFTAYGTPILNVNVLNVVP